MEAFEREKHRAKEQELREKISEQIQMFEEGYQKLKEKEELQDLELRQEAEAEFARQEWEQKVDDMQ